MSSAREYRIGELASAAGVKVRNLRYYQERGLLPPPRREGRIAWYSTAHLARLRVISDLLERGHTLNGIGELLTAWERGSAVAEVIGLEQVLTESWSREEPVTLPYAELAGLFGDRATAEDLDQAVALGYLSVDGDQVTHHSRRLLDATVALVRAGVPLRAVLATGRQLQTHLDSTATLFIDLVRRHVLDGLGRKPLPPGEVQRIADVVRRLRPVAGEVAGAEFARAMERRVRAEFGAALGSLANTARPGGAGSPPGRCQPTAEFAPAPGSTVPAGVSGRDDAPPDGITAPRTTPEASVAGWRDPAQRHGVDADGPGQPSPHPRPAPTPPPDT